MNGGQIVACAISAKPQLQRSEASFIAQCVRVRCHYLWRLKPQPIAVVRLHRPHRTAQQNAKRHTAHLCQGVPGRHIQSGHRDHGKPLIAYKMQRLACEIVKFDRCDTSALEHDAKILQGRDQISHRLDGVGFKITPPDNAFFSAEVDQDQRPVGDGGDPRDNRTPQLEYDCSRFDGFECERDKLHCKHLPFSRRRIDPCLCCWPALAPRRHPFKSYSPLSRAAICSTISRRSASSTDPSCMTTTFHLSPSG